MAHIGVVKRDERLHAGNIARGGEEKQLRNCTALLLLPPFCFAEQEASVLRRSHVARSACWPASTSRPFHQALTVHRRQGATEAAAMLRLNHSLQAMDQLPRCTQRQQQVMRQTRPAARAGNTDTIVALDHTQTIGV